METRYILNEPHTVTSMETELTLIRLFAWAIVLGVFYLVFNIVRRIVAPPKGPDRVCLDCGTHARAKIETRGHFALEIALWILFILPGLIYSIWRLTSRRYVCPACGGVRLVPPDSPAGAEMMEKLSSYHQIK